ncbi:hypothetical protein [Pseudonocardia endophytica]|uniref:Uncharacterized protein n=1 Tax=Pseudonocardia endophytica TaxID=401976 RepID=A0A4R1HIB9_PSEEN|nr:hypothetical protein [Pseudonocardia endophytica]TCK20603.1 hypothetical protein EV378_4564 [Pseudonocardia endophytica]
MANIDEIRAGIARANQQATESLGALRHARQAIEEAAANFAQNIYGTAQNDADDARSRFAAAAEKVDEVEQALHVAMQSADDVAGRL